MNQYPLLREPDLTKEEKKAAVSLLERSKTKLAKALNDPVGKHMLICYAISASLDTQADHDVVPKLHMLIKARLGGAPTLRSWLAIRGFPVYDNDPKTFELVQATRLRWVDGLINELSPVKEKQHEHTGNRKNVPHKRRQTRKD